MSYSYDPYMLNQATYTLPPLPTSEATNPIDENCKLPDLVGIMRSLYDSAKAAHRERPSTAFWCALLSRALPPDEFEPICEANPDNTGRAVDVFIYRFLPYTFELRLHSPAEVKRPNGDIEECESQAQDACWRAMVDYKLDEMLAMTADGIKFRTWRVTKQEGKKYALIPLDGGKAAIGHRDSYLDIDSDRGREVMYSYLLALYYTRPLKEVSEPPGRHGAAFPPMREMPQHPGYVQDYTENYGTRAPTGGVAGVNIGRLRLDTGIGSGTQEPQTRDGQSDEKDEKYEEDDGTSRATKGKKLMVEVKVTEEPHRFGRNLYWFKDRQGKKRETIKSDWERVKYEGRHVMVFKGKKTDYWTNHI